ncbi:MAG: Regulatory protein RecX [Gammaproteobacteria bacterium]|nr:Regulatory protein RecX [Gammaproteobacteria bacterium]
MRWLARREYSVYELKRRLIGKGYVEEDVRKALETLESRSLVSDRRFAESLFRNRVERGYGPVKIAHELKVKGVGEVLIDNVLENDSECWVTRLQAVWEKRFGHPPGSYREWARQARGLQSRGFTAEQVRRVLPEIEP